MIDPETTFVQLIEAATLRAETRKLANTSGEEAREFAMAMTALEEAGMRYTRGIARGLGVFKPVDLESVDAIAERRAFLDRVEEARS